MAKYRKKPVTVEAVRWYPPEDERHDPVATPVLKRGPGERQLGDIYLMAIRPNEYAVKSLEGPMRLTPGDWIITGVKGEKYPCKPDIFEVTYEAVEQ